MNSKIKGAKTRLAARNADKIKKAFQQAIDVEQIVESWNHTHPAGGTVTTVMARDWVRVHAVVDKKPLDAVLKNVYADGFVLGEDLGQWFIDRTFSNKAPKVSFGVIDWDTWKPGNKPAAALVRPKGGLQKLLTQRNIIVDGISITKLDRIGTVLADALNAGDSVAATAQRVNDVVDDANQAMMIASTEMARAITEAQMGMYREFGVEMLEWLVADPCDDCAENESASPIPIDGEWPQGDVPVHPNCMCDVAAYIEETSADEADINLSVDGDVFKAGVPSIIEVERALSRLEILPNPLPNLVAHPDKWVESPWRTVPVPTVNPNVWDTAELVLIELQDLVGTDPVLKRKKLKQHIEAMGQATTPYRGYALIVIQGDEQIIVDGHHRLMAMWLLGQEIAPVWMVQL
mgnify:FL=1